MQKKPGPQPPKPSGGKASGSISKAPPPRPNLVRKPLNVPPPKPMVTADDRQKARDARRAALKAAGNKPTNVGYRPATPGVAAAAGAAAGAAVGAAAAAPAGAPAEALQAEIDRFSAIQNEIMLTYVNDDVEDISSAINALPANIENIRARGYVFKSYLERKAETLLNQWNEIQPQVASAVQTQSQALQRDANQVQAALNRRQLATAGLTALESKVEAARRNVEGMYDTLDNNVNQTQQQIDDISWTLQQIEQASFGLMPTEAPVEAVPANWKKPGDKDGVDGVLYLTDQRLLFEQKEEVATKKVLFITTAKEKVQALSWAVPVGQVEKAVGSRRGLMSKDDFLTLTIQEGAGLQDAEGQFLYDDMGRPMRTTELHLKGESGEAWQGFIGRIKSGEVDKERTVPVDAAAEEAVANAPTKCANCGGTFTQKIMRGMTEITCEFCGSVTRL